MKRVIPVLVWFRAYEERIGKVGSARFSDFSISGVLARVDIARSDVWVDEGVDNLVCEVRRAVGMTENG